METTGTEIIVYAVHSPENKRLPPRSRMQLRLKTFRSREVTVRNRGIILYLPPQDLEQTSVRIPITDSGKIRSLGKTLLAEAMTAIGIDEYDGREIMQKTAYEIRENDINYISEIGVEHTTATWEECNYDEYLTIKREYEGRGDLIEIDEGIPEEDTESGLEDEEEFTIILSSAATKSSVDALDRINVSADDGMECSVCLEGIEVSEPAIRMPCLHYYHQDCIVKWLCQNHSCPLCRYELPAEL
ncbi:uncharacterized protein LOC130014727 [Mercurialis annua]|uniref:uncharacterized protein LOC130014727 n=1 Tax=Mercurialis annua TaxID=3986 RepID=UPI0024AE6B99|nr:uncharacterized protein LOC130014727 [Mercurialis annua]